jgi:hypothetical protein
MLTGMVLLEGETIPLVSSRYHDGAARMRELTCMCDKCVELGKRIERCQRVVSSIGDQLTIDRIKDMIADLKAQKVALHPEQKE